MFSRALPRRRYSSSSQHDADCSSVSTSARLLLIHPPCGSTSTTGLLCGSPYHDFLQGFKMHLSWLLHLVLRWLSSDNHKLTFSLFFRTTAVCQGVRFVGARRNMLLFVVDENYCGRPCAFYRDCARQWLTERHQLRSLQLANLSIVVLNRFT